jgi:predicted RNase H-like HicB family nuclease/DNA-binding XRE family transcriptional regulator
MKIAIPCRITHSLEDSCWYVESLPGLYSGIMTYGDSLDAAKEMASEALSGLLEVFMGEGRDIELPSLPEGPDWYAIEPSPSVAFALWLRSRRKAAGLTLTEVADRLGVKYQVYQKLENPETANPTLKTMKRLEKVFGEELVAV